MGEHCFDKDILMTIIAKRTINSLPGTVFAYQTAQIMTTFVRNLNKPFGLSQFIPKRVQNLIFRFGRYLF